LFELPGSLSQKSGDPGLCFFSLDGFDPDKLSRRTFAVAT